MQPMKRQQLQIGPHQLTLQLPADPDRLLEAAAAAGDDSDPYWGILWDAAVEMAGCVLKAEWPDGGRALEIGCGCGLVGVAGLMAGLDVTFSDLVPDAVQLSLSNATINGFPNAAGRAIDWRDEIGESFDLLLASDVLYETGQHESLLAFANRTLKPGGCLWIGDPGRQQAELFLQRAEQQGWQVQVRDRELRPLKRAVHVNFQLLVCERPVSKDDIA